MAKYERRFRGNFEDVLSFCEQTIEEGSATISLEEESTTMMGDAKVAVRVYERYGYLSSNRVSLNLTIVGLADDIFLVAAASGGSQAVFFKINTWSESNFLETLSGKLDAYIDATQ